MFEHALVPEPCGCPGKNGGLAQVLQRRTPAWGDRAKAPDYVAQSRWRSQPAAVTKPENSTRRRSKDGSHCKEPENSTLRRSKVRSQCRGTLFRANRGPKKRGRSLNACDRGQWNG